MTMERRQGRMNYIEKSSFILFRIYCGSETYTSPEVLSGARFYRVGQEIWSLGVSGEFLSLGVSGEIWSLGGRFGN